MNKNELVSSVLIALLFVSSLEDLKTSRVSNSTLLFSFLFGLFALLFSKDASLGSLSEWTAGLFLTGIPAYGLWKIGVFGAGDGKLFSVIGAFLGVQMGIEILCLSVLVGAVVSLFFLFEVRGKKLVLSLGNRIPFAPVIALSSVFIWEGWHVLF